MWRVDPLLCLRAQLVVMAAAAVFSGKSWNIAGPAQRTERQPRQSCSGRDAGGFSSDPHLLRKVSQPTWLEQAARGQQSVAWLAQVCSNTLKLKQSKGLPPPAAVVARITDRRPQRAPGSVRRFAATSAPAADGRSQNFCPGRCPPVNLCSRAGNRAARIAISGGRQLAAALQELKQCRTPAHCIQGDSSLEGRPGRESGRKRRILRVRRSRGWEWRGCGVRQGSISTCRGPRLPVWAANMCSSAPWGCESQPYRVRPVRAPP